MPTKITPVFANCRLIDSCRTTQRQPIDITDIEYVEIAQLHCVILTCTCIERSVAVNRHCTVVPYSSCFVR